MVYLIMPHCAGHLAAALPQQLLQALAQAPALAEHAASLQQHLHAVLEARKRRWSQQTGSQGSPYAGAGINAAHAGLLGLAVCTSDGQASRTQVRTLPPINVDCMKLSWSKGAREVSTTAMSCGV